VKTASKSIHFDEFTDKNKLAPFHGPLCSSSVQTV